MLDIKSAEQYFKEMGCSHFHMAREYPEKYESYKKFNISNSIEKKWREESLKEMEVDILSKNTDKDNLWILHSKMEELVKQIKNIAALETIYNVTVEIEDRLLSRSKMLVAETINGRQELKYRGGLIFLSDELKRMDICKGFYDTSLRLSTVAKIKLKSETKRCNESISTTLKIGKLLQIMKD